MTEMEGAWESKSLGDSPPKYIVIVFVTREGGIV